MGSGSSKQKPVIVASSPGHAVLHGYEKQGRKDLTGDKHHAKNDVSTPTENSWPTPSKTHESPCLEEVIEPAIRKEVAIPLGAAPTSKGRQEKQTTGQRDGKDEGAGGQNQESMLSEKRIENEPRNNAPSSRKTLLAHTDHVTFIHVKPETECIIATEPTKEIQKPFKHVWKIFSMYASVEADSLPEVALTVGKELKLIEKELHKRYKTQRETHYFGKIGLSTKCVKSCLVKRKKQDFVSLWKESTNALILSLLLNRLKRQLGITNSQNENAEEGSTNLMSKTPENNKQKTISMMENGAEALDRADEFGLTNVAEHIFEDALDLGDGLPYVKTVLSIMKSVYRIFKANASLLGDAMDLLRTIRNVEVILGGTLIAKDEKCSFLLEQLVEVLDQAEFYVIQCLMPDQNAVAKILKATSRVDNLQQLKEDIVKQLNQAMFAESMKQSEVLQTLDQKATKMLEMKMTLEQIETDQRQQTHDIQQIKGNLQEIMDGLVPSKYKLASENYLEIGPYRVQVQGGRHFKTAEGEYVELGSGYNYRLLLRNGGDRRCKAEIKIDGYRIGVFALEAEEEYVIERPVGIQRRFMFYRTTTGAAIENSGIVTKRRENGLLECKFTPELLYTFKGCLRNYKGEMSEVRSVKLGPNRAVDDFLFAVIEANPKFEQSVSAYVVQCGEKYMDISNPEWGIQELYEDWRATSAEYILLIEIAQEICVYNPLDTENEEEKSFLVGYSTDVASHVKSQLDIPSVEDVDIYHETTEKERIYYYVRILKQIVQVINSPDTLTLYLFISQDIAAEVREKLGIEDGSKQEVITHETADSKHEKFVSDVTVVIDKDISLQVTAFDGRQEIVVERTYSTVSALVRRLQKQGLMEAEATSFIHSHPERQINEVEYDLSESEFLHLALEGFSDQSTIVVKPVMFEYTIRYRHKGSEEEIDTKVEAYKQVSDLINQIEVECDRKDIAFEKGFSLVRDRADILDTSMPLRDLGTNCDLDLLSPSSKVSIVAYQTQEELGEVSDVTHQTTRLELLDKIINLLQSRENNLDDGNGKERHICIEFETADSDTSFHNTLIHEKAELKDEKVPVYMLTAVTPTVRVAESQPMQVTLHITSLTLSCTWTKEVITESCSTIAKVLENLISEAAKESVLGSVATDGKDENLTDTEIDALVKFKCLKPEWFFLQGKSTNISKVKRCFAQLDILPGATIKLTDANEMELNELVMHRQKMSERRKLSIRSLEEDAEMPQRTPQEHFIELLKMSKYEDEDVIEARRMTTGEVVHNISEYRVCSGATTLQGGSSQEFEPVDPFPLDYSNAVSVNLRMVARLGMECPLPLDDECIPLASVELLDRPNRTMMRPIAGTTVACEAPPPLPD